MKSEQFFEELDKKLDEKLAKHTEAVEAKAVEAAQAEIQKETEAKAEAEKEAETKEVEAKEEKEAKIAAQLKKDEEDEVAKAQQEADRPKWNSFSEWADAIWRFRLFGQSADNRLTFVDNKGAVSEPDRWEKKDVAVKTMTEGTDSSGGFLVPSEFREEIMSLSLESSIIRNNGARSLPMNTDTLKIPRNVDTSHASNLFGGVLAYWTEEAGTKTESEPKWGNCTLKAKKLVGLTSASDELLADNPFAFETIIKNMFADAIAYYEDVAFITGSGVGEPLGFQSANCLVTVTRQAASNVRWKDLANIYAQMLPGTYDRAVWLVNQEVLPDLITMVAENAAAAATAGSLVWISSDMGATKGIPGTILGRPFIVTEKVPALGSQGDIGCYSLPYYFIGDRSKLAVDVSKHVYFTSDKTAWRFVLRVDGQPWLESALTPKNGSNTLSPFVCLSSTS